MVYLLVLNNPSPAVYQQATSTLSTNNQGCYEKTQGCFAIYGFQYKPG
jgi:beta-glucan synthesis-associated protein KRE6